MRCASVQHSHAWHLAPGCKHELVIQSQPDAACILVETSSTLLQQCLVSPTISAILLPLAPTGTKGVVDVTGQVRWQLEYRNMGKPAARMLASGQADPTGVFALLGKVGRVPRVYACRDRDALIKAMRSSALKRMGLQLAGVQHALLHGCMDMGHQQSPDRPMSIPACIPLQDLGQICATPPVGSGCMSGTQRAVWPYSDMSADASAAGISLPEDRALSWLLSSGCGPAVDVQAGVSGQALVEAVGAAEREVAASAPLEPLGACACDPPWAMALAPPRRSSPPLLRLLLLCRSAACLCWLCTAISLKQRLERLLLV